MYFYGQEVVIDYAKAAYWYRRASQYNDDDIRKADFIVFFSKKFEQNKAANENGLGVVQDNRRALYYYTLSCVDDEDGKRKQKAEELKSKLNIKSTP